ncbi:hypothetical protein C0995_012532 [Termitomyces sp. Mi166|nr:hypothetical protein C0995_012532 [Termitomyces sp. Mi166\
MEGKFVSIDDESKGYRVFWLKRDVYFSKDAALNPDNIQIEGEWDAPAKFNNPDISQVSTPSSPSKTNSSISSDITKLEPSSLLSENTKIIAKKVEKPIKNLSKLPQNTLDTSQTKNSPSSSLPHL